MQNPVAAKKALNDFHDACDQAKLIMREIQFMAEGMTKALKPFADPAFRKIVRKEIAAEQLEIVRNFHELKAAVSMHTTTAN